MFSLFFFSTRLLSPRNLLSLSRFLCRLRVFHWFYRASSLLYSAFSPAVMSLHYAIRHSPYHIICPQYRSIHHIRRNQFAITPINDRVPRIPRTERLYSTLFERNDSRSYKVYISGFLICFSAICNSKMPKCRV